MNFTRVLKEVLWCLVTEGGISYRRIKLSYGLDDDAVEELRRELISIKQVAVDVDGERLVWAPQIWQTSKLLDHGSHRPRCVLPNRHPSWPRHHALQPWRETCRAPRGVS